MDRTIVAQLHPTSELYQVLKRTIEEHTACFNAVADFGFLSKCSNGVELHKATYYDLRHKYPDLPAQLVCAARVKATEAVKSALTWQKKHEANYPKRVAKAKKAGKEPPKFKPVRAPRSLICPIRYDARSYWVKWETMTASLATVAGRVQVDFTVPEYAREYSGYQVCSADLCYRKSKFTLHIVVSLPEPNLPPTQEIIGVDLGLNRPAVLSNRHFLGERRWKEQERRIFRIRRKLQAKGTKSANKKVDLKRRMHSWSFAQLSSFTEYKAAARGSIVTKVDPRQTSQTCSKCGYHHRSNRRSQSLFKCRQCGYCLNADLNASKNIREKYITSLASVDTSSLVGTSVNVPIVSTLRSEGQPPVF
jgi:putative transposase